jgi:hypothetical protein
MCYVTPSEKIPSFVGVVGFSPLARYNKLAYTAFVVEFGKRVATSLAK